MAKYRRDFTKVTAGRKGQLRREPVADPWGDLLSEIEDAGLFDTLFPGPGDFLPPFGTWDAEGYLCCAHCKQRNRVPSDQTSRGLEEEGEPF